MTGPPDGKKRIVFMGSPEFAIPHWRGSVARMTLLLSTPSLPGQQVAA